jgi:hypothetical protein
MLNRVKQLVPMVYLILTMPLEARIKNLAIMLFIIIAMLMVGDKTAATK